MINLANLDVETRERWAHNDYFEYGKTAHTMESAYLRSLTELVPWVPYEKYMRAKLIAAVPGRVGLLHIDFPPETAEDNRIHTHLYSDRLITVMEGSGYFILAQRGEPIKSIPVHAGDRVWMPRGVRHTWYSGSQGLLVESVHNPFFAFDDPRLLVYDEGLGYLEFNSDGTFVERKLAGDISGRVHRFERPVGSRRTSSSLG